MVQFQEIFSDLKKTLIFSVLLHIILFAIFLTIKVGFDFSPADFAEVSFVATSRGASRTPAPQVVQPIKPKPRTVASQAAPPVVQKQTPKNQPVNLPKRRMLEEDDTEPLRYQTGKLSPNVEKTELPPATREYDTRQVGRGLTESNADEKLNVGPGETFVDGKDMAPSSDIGGPTQYQPFTIEGDAAKRSILKQVIPEYPEGLQKEAIVRIRFTVLPNGSVGQTIPVQKGDPVLDEITMQALRKWRFNPLSPGAGQQKAEGIITFRYELQ